MLATKLFISLKHFPCTTVTTEIPAFITTCIYNIKQFSSGREKRLTTVETENHIFTASFQTVGHKNKT